MSVLDFIRADVRAASVYHVADLPDDVLKLDAMEMPYRFPEHLQAKLAQRLAAAPINRYPNPASSGLHDALRQAFAIPEHAAVALGNGSDELIQLLTMLLARPNATMLCVEPSFVMYRRNAELFGMNYAGVPLNDDFTLNLPALLDAVAQHQPALIFLAYPNNPTGVRFARAEVEAVLAAANGVVVVDEAYGAFSGDSFLPQAGTPENLVVMRTLSKIGFAGLRIGYAAGSPRIFNELAKITPPYNMNWLSLTAAQFALENMAWVNEHIELLKAERTRMQTELSALPNLRVFAGETNFLTVRLPDAETAFNKLKQHNILVKNLHGSHALLDNCLRLTIGTPDDNTRVLAVLQQCLR